jgi:fluoride ion exporter CrcB/FEX
MAFIVGAMVGNLFGMFLMGLLVASRDRDHADRVHREHKEGL